MTVANGYVPAQGDLVMMEFGPQQGQEIGKRRPAVVISEQAFNRRRGLCFVAAVSRAASGESTEVDLPPNLRAQGSIMTDQMRSVDWRKRGMERIGRVPDRIVEDTLDRVCAILGVIRQG